MIRFLRKRNVKGEKLEGGKLVEFYFYTHGKMIPCMQIFQDTKACSNRT